MGNVVTLQDITPAARFDGVAWTSVTIGESASASGPFNQIADITLMPTDPDPTNPGPRSFTTAAATLSTGWYQVTFIDPDGGQQVMVAIDYPPPAEGAELVYCTVLDVQARTSSRQITATSKPSIADVQGFIQQAAATINAVLVNKGYTVPIDGTLYPDAWATVHKANIDGAWALSEASAQVSTNQKIAQAAWDASLKMLADQELVLNAEQDVERVDPRGPWLTSQPTGDTFNPMDGRRGVNSYNQPRNPYFSREQQF